MKAAGWLVSVAKTKPLVPITFRILEHFWSKLLKTSLACRHSNSDCNSLPMIRCRVDSRQNCRWELATLALFVSFFMFAPRSLTIAAPAHQEFRWAADPEGGAPFVEADPAHPDRVVGFDVEIAEIIAQGLNRSATFLNVAFTSIDQSIERDDAEIGLGGIEDTPARRATMAPTVPYYRFREVLSVRETDASRFRTRADLRGRRIGTLGGTIAYEILLRAEREFGIKPVSYDDDVHPYTRSGYRTCGCRAAR
jgi:ABC-type amino acid transport substrate-binding protein